MQEYVDCIRIKGQLKEGTVRRRRETTYYHSVSYLCVFVKDTQFSPEQLIIIAEKASK